MDWYGHQQYLCPACLQIAQKILREAAEKGENVESNLPTGESKKYAGLTVVGKDAGGDRRIHRPSAGNPAQ